MKKISKVQERKKKQNFFVLSLFAIFLVVLFLMSGIHVGLIVLMNIKNANELIQIIVPMVYWAVIAAGLTAYTGWRVKKMYEVPVNIMAKATAKVAGGDFSVYIPPQHTSDKLDYLDVMFSDFNKMVEELGSIETLKTDFFSNVSHEMKTPLAVIQNNAELLQKDGITDEQRKECVRSILQSTKRLSSLITNILKLNKLEKQVIQPKPQSYDICAQLCECALQFENVWEEKEIEFNTDIEDRAIIEADEGLLESVWTNLLSNAFKFTPRGGTITLSQSSDKDKIIVSVSDTGCGMDEETLRHIYDKFYQEDTSHSTEGNGLGLALVNRILQLSNGTITVKSFPRRGTVFTVTLPVSPEIGGEI